MATGETVRIAAVADIHCTKTSQGALQPLFAQARRQRRRAAAVRRPDRLRPARGGARPGARAGRRAPSMPTIAVLGNHDFESGQAEEVAQILCDAGRDDARRRGCEVMGIGFAGVKGFCRRVRPRRARLVGRAGDQGVRARGARRGAQARVGAGPAAHRAARRRAALRADPGHGRGRAAGDLPLPRLQPPGGAAQPLPGGRRLPRPRPPRQPGGRRPAPASRSTTSRCRCCAPPSPTARRSACWSCASRRTPTIRT